MRKQGNEEFSDEEFLARKRWRGKNEEKLVFLGKKLILFRKNCAILDLKTFHFFPTLVTDFSGEDHQYVSSNYLLYFAMELFSHHFHMKI